ncbi:glycosyl hydrolase family 71-domain-containing protein [Ustulina deusta]|nr:glycosyl hydrolase family 71-domain-containing protein [Ustulina deusta]
MPTSPWFFTHFGLEVPYSKNWGFPSDTLWFDRWEQILELQPQYLEIVTRNDYAEFHYIGRLDSPHGKKECRSLFPISVYWFCPTPTDLDCDAPDTTPVGVHDNSSGNYFKGRPNGWETMKNEVFVVTLLTQAA